MTNKYQMELITSRYFDLLEARERNGRNAADGGYSRGFAAYLHHPDPFRVSYRSVRLERSLEKSLRDIEMNSPDVS